MSIIYYLNPSYFPNRFKALVEKHKRVIFVTSSFLHRKRVSIHQLYQIWSLPETFYDYTEYKAFKQKWNPEHISWWGSWKVWYLGIPDPSKAKAAGGLKTVTITNLISIHWPPTCVRHQRSQQCLVPQPADRERASCPHLETCHTDSTTLWGGASWVLKRAEIYAECIRFGPQNHFNQNWTRAL